MHPQLRRRLRRMHFDVELLSLSAETIPVEDARFNTIVLTYTPLPDTANQPAPDATHKAVFSVTRKAEDRGQPNPGLDHVARAVNLFASAGVPLACHAPSATSSR